MEENIHEEVLAMIRFGDLDLYLTQIEEAIKRRSETILGQQVPPMCPECGGMNGQHKNSCPTRQKEAIRKGDTVMIRLDSDISPRYMRGKEFPVIRVNAVTVTVGPVPEDRRYGRFAGKKWIRIPKKTLRKVS